MGHDSGYLLGVGVDTHAGTTTDAVEGVRER